MKKRHYALFLLLLLAFAFPLQSTKVNKADLDAGYILVGRVDEAEGFFGVNDRGDQLIFSRVRVKVERWIKGRDGNSIEFIVEGGSVGDLALKVSEYPEFSRGRGTGCPWTRSDPLLSSARAKSSRRRGSAASR